MKKQLTGKDAERKFAKVVPLARVRKLNRLEPAVELRALANELRACATSADTVASREDMNAVKRELDRVRRMLVARENLRDSNELDARMRFTQEVDFSAVVSRTVPETFSSEARRDALQQRARILVTHVQTFYPTATRNLDCALVAQAIDRRAKGRWDWKIMASAWGRDVKAESWRVEWENWRRQKSQP